MYGLLCSLLGFLFAMICIGLEMTRCDEIQVSTEGPCTLNCVAAWPQEMQWGCYWVGQSTVIQPSQLVYMVDVANHSNWVG